MKILTGLIAVFNLAICFGQTNTSTRTIAAPQMETSSRGILYFEEFNNNKNNWTVDENKSISSRIDSGLYYVTAVAHAYGEAQEVKIDTRKNFEVETRIKILSGNSDHKNYYSMLFWGREGMNGYYFTFARDGFASIELCHGKNQSDCITKDGSLQTTRLNPDQFNVYKIKKIGATYSFFVNGLQFYEMPFAPFFGNLIGFGAGRKVSLAIDYLKVSYL